MTADVPGAGATAFDDGSRSFLVGLSQTLRRKKFPLRRWLARRRWPNRTLPWWLWCHLCAFDSMAVTWVVAIRAGRPLTFVQIGSNDGVVFDPLHEAVKAFNWSGVLVEPVPDVFGRLQANYHGVPDLAFENVAIGEQDGEAILYSVTPGPDDPYWTNQIASFDKAVILSHRDTITALEDRVEELRVPTLTLNTLVSRHQLTALDFLHIDVEGFDQEIIKQIDFRAGWAPRFIIFERQHMSRKTHRQVRRLLRGAGYRLVNIWPDELAYRRR
ncbi:MAG TPA: FkbM family methyltransferase [Acidimicrobiaceae bacterium]|nr:FkbM family methyltransferase [Acidimicrobiaceae bacterium]